MAFANIIDQPNFKSLRAGSRVMLERTTKMGNSTEWERVSDTVCFGEEPEGKKWVCLGRGTFSLEDGTCADKRLGWKITAIL